MDKMVIINKIAKTLLIQTPGLGKNKLVETDVSCLWFVFSVL